MKWTFVPKNGLCRKPIITMVFDPQGTYIHTDLFNIRIFRYIYHVYISIHTCYIPISTGVDYPKIVHHNHHTVDGNQISGPVELGSSSHYLQGNFTSQVFFFRKKNVNYC